MPPPRAYAILRPPAKTIIKDNQSNLEFKPNQLLLYVNKSSCSCEMTSHVHANMRMDADQVRQHHPRTMGMTDPHLQWL